MRHTTRLGTAGVLAVTAIVGTAWAGAAGATTTPEASTETLVVGRTGDIDNLDPQLATAFQTIDALELVYDTLTYLAPDLTVQPALATDWTYNEDGTELTFNLREGVTFHDGSELTSEDVVASLERVLDEETGAAGARVPALDRGGHRARRSHRRAQPVDGRRHAAVGAEPRGHVDPVVRRHRRGNGRNAAQRDWRLLLRRVDAGSATRPHRLRGLLGRGSQPRRREHPRRPRRPVPPRCLAGG